MPTMPRLRNLRMTLDYAEDTRLFRSRQSRIAITALVLVIALAPLHMSSDLWLSVLNYAGIAAIGAIGLNLLTGYTGQVSLGHAFFIGTGAYAATWLGGVKELPLPVWLVGAAVIGGVLGAVVGPFALRLRGQYLAVVSLGLIYVGRHVFENFESVTGGHGGTSVTPPLELGLDFNAVDLGWRQFNRNQSFFWLIWILVGVTALIAKNVVRTRPGRAMQAVRDRDIAAEIIGVSLARYKIGAFVLSSAMAAVAGALFGAYQQFVQPDQWDLLLSIQYIAIIIIGGVGTIAGAVLGAVFLGAIPQLVDRASGDLPFVAQSVSDDGISVDQLNLVIYGLLIVVFLMFEPRGLAALWRRVKTYFTTWPFSY